MKPYKLEFSKFEMFTDNKAKGNNKKKLQRKVRRQLKREWKKDLKEDRDDK